MQNAATFAATEMRSRADHRSTSNQCDLVRSVMRQPWSEYGRT